MITEGARDNALERFLPYFQQMGMNISISQLKKALLAKFTQEAGIRNLSLSSNYYLLGVAKYYFNGDLTSNKKLNILYPNVQDRFITPVCEKLNDLILILRNAYIDSVGTKWEQPEDFGKLSIEQLFKKYSKKLNPTVKPQKQEEEELAPISNKAGNGYTFEVITDFDQLPKFKAFTEPGAWCITYGKQHYNTYCRMYHGHFVIFLKKGYQNVQRKVGKGFTKEKPQDKYGNSMIAAIQSNTSPDLKLITSRWNHGSSVDGTEGTEADHAYTQEEFLRIIGDDGSVLERAFQLYKRMEQAKKKATPKVDRSEASKQKLKVLRWFKYAQMRLDGGVHPQEIFHSPEGPIVQVRPIDERSAGDSKRVMGTYILLYPAGQDGMGAVTLMDRKKIFLNDFFIPIQGGTYERPSIVNYEKCAVILPMKGVYLIFDKVRHLFLNIDGTTKFKYVSPNVHFPNAYSAGNTDTKEPPYVIVALTRTQLALVNMAAMKPVRARNGSAWFEAIVRVNTWMSSNVGYANDIQLPNLSKPQCLKMVYDHAAQEEYLFSTASNSFLDTSDIPDEFYITPKKAIDGYVVFMKRPFPNSRPDLELFMLKSITDGQILNINGWTTFENVNKVECVIGFTPVRARQGLYYDEVTKEIITFDNQPVTFPSGEKWIREAGNTGFVVISYKEYLIYNPFTHSFRYNPETHSYNVAWIGGPRFKAVGQVGGKYFNLPSAQEDAEMQQNQIESIKKQFKQITEQMDNILQDFL